MFNSLPIWRVEVSPFACNLFDSVTKFYNIFFSTNIVPNADNTSDR